MSYKIIEGDCIEQMSKLEESSIDAIVTDPPYGLEFMGKEWDKFKDKKGKKSNAKFPGQTKTWTGKEGSGIGLAAPRFGTQSRKDLHAFQDWTEEWAVEALRVLKPGGHLLAFGGSRTYHRLASAVEDAGFEIRDQIMWLYGSGFPKSLNVGKKIDSWDGWGTALKPAHEPIVVARKPLIGTVAANVLEHGTGAINIDGCRVGSAADMNPNDFDDTKRKSPKFSGVLREGGAPSLSRKGGIPDGRWPANIILDEEAGALLDEQSGERKSGGKQTSDKSNSDGLFGFGGQPNKETAPSSGGASRFFYCAKAGKKERNAGLEGFEEGAGPDTLNSSFRKKSGTRSATNRKNIHPTVKPIALMAYLCRLVTPPGGVILDPFLGSGSTGCAAIEEGFDFVGIEREKEYVAICQARLAHWANQPTK